MGRFYTDFLFHRVRAYKWLFIALAIALLVLLLVLIGTLRRQAEIRRINRTDALAERITQQWENRFTSIPALTAREMNRLRRFKNPTHVARARKLGVGRIDNRDTVHALERREELIALQDNHHFNLQEMNYSVPSVTPATAQLLHHIGAQFQDTLRKRGLPPYRFIITSGTRTRANQAALRSVNVNAAGTSSHEFGTTVDLHYGAFDIPPRAIPLPDSDTLDIDRERLRDSLHAGAEQLARDQSERLKAVLGRVLLVLQKQGQVLVIYERRQPVYHITVGTSEIPSSDWPPFYDWATIDQSSSSSSSRQGK